MVGGARGRRGGACHRRRERGRGGEGAAPARPRRARATAAAEAAHELAVEHAKTRHAFGRPIGAFQAVSHRCANAEIAVVAARRLVDEAVRLYDRRDPDWPLASELAVAYAAEHARRVQLAAQHTLAAIGFFEEHAAPWLFRRVHADVSRIATFPPASGEAADILLERGVSLPRLELGEAAEAFRGELATFLDARGDLAHDAALTPALAAAGYVGMAWPAEHGGRDASPEELMVIHEELRYRGADAKVLAAAELIGNAIIRHGTADQQARFLPRIARGELPFYLGYSESEVGSDLANLRTRAVRKGEDWVVSGQKLWGPARIEPSTAGSRRVPIRTCSRRMPGSPSSSSTCRVRAGRCRSTSASRARSRARRSSTTSVSRTRHASAR